MQGMKGQVCARRFACMWGPSITLWWLSCGSDIQCEADQCLLSCEDLGCIAYAVLASDGRVYDALHLRDWVRVCLETPRPVSVVPGHLITWVKPVRVRINTVAAPVTAHMHTQTHAYSLPDNPPPQPQPPPRPLTPCVGPRTSRRRTIVPHPNSAFRRVRA